MRDDDRICEALTLMLGARTVHELPVIARTAPRWWQVIARAEEREINASLALLGLKPIDDEARAAYWREVNSGQGIEDAGGYIWRCWRAALKRLDPHGVGC